MSKEKWWYAEFEEVDTPLGPESKVVTTSGKTIGQLSMQGKRDLANHIKKAYNRDIGKLKRVYSI